MRRALHSGLSVKSVKRKQSKANKPATKTPIRTLVVEDSPTAMRAVANLLELFPAVQLVGMAGNGDEGLQLTAKFQPDLVLMDMELPGMDGLTLTELLHKQFPAMRLVVTSSHEGDGWQRLVAAHGGDAFIPKSRLPAELAGIMARFFPQAAWEEVCQR
ncbi:MAG: response regulator transcription factor [Verrucomicrobia bacterium]|nr:response regulator transcription factor [Verrucomicrobiota bacterium]